MENAIFKTDEQLVQKGFKQIYPNNNNVEISMKSWSAGWLWDLEWQWIRSVGETDKLTVCEKFKERRNIFLAVDVGYHTVNLYLKKPSQTKTYRVKEIYIANNNKQIILDKANARYYNKIVKKIDKIYYNIDKGHLLIVIDEDFISKKEKKLLKEIEKTETDKSSIEDLFN